MSLTWNAPAEPRSFNAAGRLIAFVLAAALCAALTYLAVTQRFGVIADLFDEIGTIVVITPEKPPAPPPLVRQTPPPPLVQRATEINPEAPPTPTLEPVVQQAEPAPPATTYLNATFLERPSGRDFERYFPSRALVRGISGRVVLDCRVAEDGRVSCAVASEDPAGWGFGEASLRAARHFRVAPATADGRPTAGGRLSVPMTWRVN